MFRALVLTQQDKKTNASIQYLNETQLPQGNVQVKVSYSSLNYKDGLVITGTGRLVRQFPMIPGIDFVGTVLQSEDPRYQINDKVILTGWGVGENHWGGMAEKAQVPGNYLVPLPAHCTEKQAMFIGTAGLTAMLCVQALLDAGLTPEDGNILVTGASGGVGTTSIALLSQLGFSVTAVTGRMQNNHQLLSSLGAKAIIEREKFEEPAKPLEKQQWAGAIDTVGNHVLAKLLTQINYGGAVAICGLAGGFALPTTVMPFILRNVSLLGIDSVNCPQEKRIQAWNKIIKLLPEHFFANTGTEITLEEAPNYAKKIIAGQVTGRTLIKL